MSRKKSYISQYAAVNNFNPRLAISEVLGRAGKSVLCSEMNFSQYLREAWPILEPVNPLIEDWYIDYLCEHLELVTKGEITRLLVNVPPRLGKSNIFTIAWPTWSWTRRSYLRFVFCSYSATLAKIHSIARRDLLISNWYKENWGGVVRLSDDQNEKQEYKNTSQGRMTATSVGGSATGKGGDVIVEDDMMNPEEAESEAMRRHAISMHQNVLSSRLDNPKTGVRVIIEQRLHENDLTAHVLKNEFGYVHINLDMEAQKKTIIDFPESKRKVVREPGDLLSPNRIGKKEIENIRRSMGTRRYNAQYQQEPVGEDGNLVNPKWFRFFHDEPQKAVGHCQMIAQSWDMSFKGKDDSSHVCGLVGGKRSGDIYILDEYREQKGFPGTIKLVHQASKDWPQSSAKWIEDKANGPAIIESLQHRIAGIIPANIPGSKEARMSAASPMIESGNVYLPFPYDAEGRIRPDRQWVVDFMDEIARFPAKPNDRGDSLAQLILKLSAEHIVEATESNEDDNFLDDMDDIAMGW